MLTERRSKEFGQGDLKQRELCTDTKEWLRERGSAGSLSSSSSKLTLQAVDRAAEKAVDGKFPL